MANALELEPEWEMVTVFVGKDTKEVIVASATRRTLSTRLFLSPMALFNATLATHPAPTVALPLALGDVTSARLVTRGRTNMDALILMNANLNDQVLVLATRFASTPKDRFNVTVSLQYWSCIDNF